MWKDRLIFFLVFILKYFIFHLLVSEMVVLDLNNEVSKHSKSSASLLQLVIWNINRRKDIKSSLSSLFFFKIFFTASDSSSDLSWRCQWSTPSSKLSKCRCECSRWWKEVNFKNNLLHIIVSLLFHFLPSFKFYECWYTVFLLEVRSMQHALKEMQS